MSMYPRGYNMCLKTVRAGNTLINTTQFIGHLKWVRNAGLENLTPGS